jgi:PPOX class probable F420-dependent enzyme
MSEELSPIELDAEVVSVLCGPDNLSFLATVNPDGSPQVTLVRPTYEGGEILIAHMSLYQKVRNIRRDDRVVLSTQAPGGFEAHYPYLTITGRATVTEGGAMELLSRIIAADAAKTGRAMPPPPPGPPPTGGYITHITPYRLGGRGPWAPGTGPRPPGTASP